MGFDNQYNTSINIDQLVYGDILLKDKQIILSTDRILNYLSKNGELSYLMNIFPPANSSIKTFKELKILESITNSATEEEIEFSKLAEFNEELMYENFCKSIGLNLNQIFFKKLFKQINPLLMYLKIYFNRPRPYQLAPYYGIKLKNVSPSDALHPSYPSGHGLDSYVAEHVIKYFSPDMSKEIKMFCGKMKDSRMVLGVHFPSDNIYSKQIFDILDKNNLIKIPNIS
jgi:hypothetical protein